MLAPRCATAVPSVRRRSANGRTPRSTAAPLAEAIITLVMTLVAHGGPIAACGLPRLTVAAWMDAARVPCAAVDQQGGLPRARPGCGTGGREPGHATGWHRLGGIDDAGHDPTLARWGSQPMPQWCPIGEFGAPDAPDAGRGAGPWRVERAGALWAGWLVGTGDNCCPSHRSLA